MSGIIHPEVINGRVEWRDSGMDRLIYKIQHGDGVHGWEGDPRLAVYMRPTPIGPIYELWRLEEDEQYRRVVATAPGDPFDDAIIVWLVQNDRRRKADNWTIGDVVNAHNAKREAAREAARSEWVREDFGPRFLHAVKKDAGW
jgi:hypothetical protein